MKYTYVSALILVSMLSGCSARIDTKSEVQCIVLPRDAASVKQDHAIKLKADLEQIPINGELETKFTNTASVAFKELSNVNVTLNILIQGAYCFVKKGADKALAEKLIDAATKLALGAYGIAGVGSSRDRTLSTTAQDEISKRPGAEELIARLKEAGYKLAD